MAKSTRAAKPAAKSTKAKPAAKSDNQIARNEKSYVAFFEDLKQGNKDCTITVTTDAGSITLKGVKAYPHITNVVNENGRDWLKGDI